MTTINHNVQCTVEQCKFHQGNENYCTLSKVQIGTHELNPTMDECTDCQSFQLRG